MTNEQLREIKMAWARGEAVQYLGRYGWHDWDNRDCLDMGRAGATKWRIKPKTIRIGSYDVPEPLRSFDGVAEYWLVDLSECMIIMSYEKHSTDHNWLREGRCHATREAAELHAKALLSFTEKK